MVTRYLVVASNQRRGQSLKLASSRGAIRFVLQIYKEKLLRITLGWFLMVRCCINSACHAEFTVLSGGAVYAYERPSADTEFFWLCSACAPKFELYLDSKGCVLVRERNNLIHPQPPDPDRRLRLVVHTEGASSISHWQLLYAGRREGIIAKVSHEE